MQHIPQAQNSDRIMQLDHQNSITAQQIHAVLRNAYQVEAALLGAADFPPLRRSVNDIMTVDSIFYGLIRDGLPAAVVEVETIAVGHLHIASLAVAPDHFRKGYGSKVVESVLDVLAWDEVTVSTAVANKPAIALYKKQGFQPLSFTTTPDGFKLITLHKKTCLDVKS